MSPHGLSKYAVLVGLAFYVTGRYLASEMWAAILSQPTIEANDRLRQLLLRQTDFESALAEAEIGRRGLLPRRAYGHA